MPGPVSDQYEGVIAHRAAQPCECHLPPDERQYEQDPPDPKCVPCWARECLAAADEFLQAANSEVTNE